MKILVPVKRVVDHTVKVCVQSAGKLSLPAIIAADLRLHKPRYVTLPNIIKAKKKTLEVLKLSELGVDMRAHLKTLMTV